MKNYSAKIGLSNMNNSHSKLVMMCGYDKRVLDIGCSYGHLAMALKERGCTVVGVELDPEAASEASTICERVIVGDLDQLDLQSELRGESFDVALFGDVIEHLKSPQRLLTEIRTLLAPGGFIGVSVPNIAHASIRLMLMRGEFSYSDLGILDDTHLRFFTKKSICDLLTGSGYIVDSVDWTEVEVRERELKESIKPPLKDLVEVAKSFSGPESIAFQYVIKASPANEPERVMELSRDKMLAERRVAELESAQAVFEDLKKHANGLEAERENLIEAIQQLKIEAGETKARLDAVEQKLDSLNVSPPKIRDPGQAPPYE